MSIFLNHQGLNADILAPTKKTTYFINVEHPLKHPLEPRRFVASALFSCHVGAGSRLERGCVRWLVTPTTQGNGVSAPEQLAAAVPAGPAPVLPGS